MSRVFIDTLTANKSDAADFIKKAVEEGNTLVVPNTVLDVRAFQENPEWLGQQLEAGKVIIQIFIEADAMVSKPFCWSSINTTTPACESFEECLENYIPEESKAGVQAVWELMKVYGLSKEEWNPGQWAAPQPLAQEHCEILGLTPEATRSEVLEACEKIGRMDIFDDFNANYNAGLVCQHHCDAIMGIEGELKAIN